MSNKNKRLLQENFNYQNSNNNTDTTLFFDDDADAEVIDMKRSVNNINRSIKREIRNQMTWIEKYRPKTINDMILDDDMAVKIKTFVQEKNLPNLIIGGSPGIGKTTTVYCIANEFYGEYFRDAVMESNASDDRSIKMMEDAINNFCKKSLKLPSQYAQFKMIIFDEVDNISAKVQYLISKKMGEFETVKFLFTCNETTGIIEAIQSKCIILRYLKLSAPKIISRLSSICIKENVKYDNESLNELAIISQGDVRNAINYLQIVYNSYNEISKDNIYKISDTPQPHILLEILLSCKNCDIVRVFTLAELLKKKGCSDFDIVMGLINVLRFYDTQPIPAHLLYLPKLSELDKMIMFKIICKYSYNISIGVTGDIQLYSCVSSIILAYKNQKSSFLK